jgi:RNA polymerase sigma factor (sigma-70 family)
MQGAIPETLRSLLEADEGAGADAAWEAFLRDHSDLLLRIARSLGGDEDAAMDRYAFVLDSLRRDRFQRLRAYADDGRNSFGTWLVVVTRRLCLDHHRKRYGRSQSDSAGAVARHRGRRQLTDLVGVELGLDQLEAGDGRSPDTAAVQQDQSERLARCLSALDVEDRLILRLRYEEGLSVPSIAQLLHEESPFKLYRRVERILAGLRARLEELGIRDAGR